MAIQQYTAAAKELVRQMTRAEKAALCSGQDFWHIKGVERLSLAPVCITDGPHGLRKELPQQKDVVLGKSVPATCFPTACAAACSFDEALLEEEGRAMAEECLAEEVAVILGPGTNLKRSPLCGRNFEYFSEDPLLGGKCAAALIRGVESKNVGTSLKHFAGNNQEAARLVSNSVIDERALRENYLTAFEIAVKEGKPATVMCSYNRLNDTYASDNKRLLTDILRTEWGFDGLVMSDWGAVNDRVKALAAGCDLEMPGPCPGEDAQILRAIEQGALTDAQLDAAAERIVRVLLRGAQNKKQPYDAAAHHALAGRIAAESAVLAQNDGVLPLASDTKLAVIGGFAKMPRYQGAGSSQIAPTQLTGALEAFDAAGVSYRCAEGFAPEELTPSAEKVAEAARAAREADVAVVFAALPASYESEGFDRDHLSLPESQLAVIDAVCATDTPTVIVLASGSAVCLPFAARANAILLMNLSGQNSGWAACELLFGRQNPCGKLAETWPLSLSSTGSGAWFGQRQAEYRESVFTGYRWYDASQTPVQWPFGHGLSYTTFAYSAMKLSASSIAHTDTLTVTFTVTNTGARTGKEIAQVYVGAPESTLFAPVRQLRTFAKVELAPGESKEISLTLAPRAFAYYNVPAARWHVAGGAYTVFAGPSSRTLPLSATVQVAGDASLIVPDYRAAAPAYYAFTPGQLEVPKAQFEAVLGRAVPALPPLTPFTRNTAARDLKATLWGRIAFAILKTQAAKAFDAGVGGASSASASNTEKMLDGMVYDMPIRSLAMLSGGALTPARLDGLIAILNGHLIRGVRALCRKPRK